MAKPTLVIGNKNYSSWSIRPYMALAMAGIAFDEKLTDLVNQPLARPFGKYQKLD